MHKELATLLRGLVKERFGGKEPEWKEAMWGGVEVLSAEDEDNWYHQYKGNIYVQPKRGKVKVPHCYDCGSNTAGI